MKTNKRILRATMIWAVMGLCLALLVPLQSAQAANDTGSVVGRTAPGATVTVVDPDTGFTRTVTASADGSYRFPFLPIGTYRLQASKGGSPVGQPVDITVTLGNATNASSGVNATNLQGVQVVHSVVASAVDVTSTESATNVTREELARLPVDQTVGSVALLAPGVNKGTASFGGLSFGGSSIAENSFYVNGLNVTDFYNRNGFSEAPFAFYQEFQVKTGGYSVEFGRSTGGVVNAVTRSGSNEFKYGAQLTLEPRAWQSSGDDHYHINQDGERERYYTASQDNYSRQKLNVYASGPIVKDKLFFFAMYEARDYQPQNTNNAGTTLTQDTSDDGFWGAKLDWNINDSNTLGFFAFSDKNKDTGDVYGYDFDSDTKTPKTNEIYTDTGGKNWALTYTSYLTDNLSAKLLYGENDREAFTRSLRDVECNRVVADSAIPDPGVQLGCTTSSSVNKRMDNRKEERADFEWTLGDHLLRFGVDRERNTSDYSRFYPGPSALYYNIYPGNAGDTIENGGTIPAGYDGYVRARRYEIAGNFETDNYAYYLEDNWSITPNFLLNAGLRLDAFDNKDGDGNSYIKIDNQVGPRFGFSWDMKGDGSTKLFGNLGRYYLPVANVINIKQAGGLLDERTYYAFDGYDIQDLDGLQYAVPRLGPQIGPVDTSQGDGTVGDLRSEVDRDIDPVYQDEAILGFEQMLSDKWSWGVTGTYRRLHNAIDDMQISATPQCGGDGYIGYVMANPGKEVTVYGDTDCDGVDDGYLTIDTSKEGFALYTTDENGDEHYVGQTGFPSPKRTYKALEFQIDRAWDGKWALNASYTLSFSQGNAEGPVNSDTNFDDAGRTENFDKPWVNYRGYGYLANDRRHQFKLRGTYALSEHWRLGGDVNIHSGGPITGFGVGDPFDDTNYHSYYICVEKCGNIPGEFDADGNPLQYPSDERVYVHSARGAYGTTPWIYDLSASISYLTKLGENGNLQVKFAVYNLLDQKQTVSVDQDLQTTISNQTNPYFGEATGFQSPRYSQLTVTVDF